MKCECDSMSCSHYDARDASSIARCQQEATQATMFHQRPDGVEMCFECAQDAVETLENVDYVCLECGKKHREGACFQRDSSTTETQKIAYIERDATIQDWWIRFVDSNNDDDFIRQSHLDIASPFRLPASREALTAALEAAGYRVEVVIPDGAVARGEDRRHGRRL